jgi:hypothetical protein
VLASIISQEYDARTLYGRARARNVPVEYVYIAAKGLARDRAKRFQSVDELEQEINKARDGWGPVKCYITFGKRVAYGMAHFIDRHFILYSVIFFGTMLSLLSGIVFAILKLSHILP